MVAKAAAMAPPRGMLQAVKDARLCSEPSAKRLLRQAREAGLLEHSTRSLFRS
jgi:hypothetical protein